MSGQSGGTVWEGAERHLPLLAIVVSSVVFLNVLDNGFYADDYFHLYDCANGPFWKTLLTPHGGHMLFAYNAVFLILFNVFGLNPAAYFAVLLLVHGVCVYLLYAIIHKLTKQPYLAAFGATLWGMCPVNAGSLSFISVLGHVFATAAILTVVLDLIRLEKREETDRNAVFARIYCLLLVAAFSFGVGLGVALGFAAVFFVWNPVPARRVQLTLFFGTLMILLPAIYFGTAQQEALEHPFGIVSVASALVRFSLVGLGSLLGGPLLMGEVAVLPESQVLAAAASIGVLGVIVIVVGMVRADSGMRTRMIALTGLIACGYGLIALGRHWMFGGFPPPVPRYHYLGPALFSVLLCVSASAIFEGVDLFRRRGAPLYFGWLLVVIVPYNMAIEKPPTSHPVVHNHYDTLISLNRDIGFRVRHGGTGPIYLENTGFETGQLPGWSKKTEFPGLAAFYIITHAENDVDGRPVRFYTDDEALLELTRAEAGSRIAELLVSVDEKNEYERSMKRRLRDP